MEAPLGALLRKHRDSQQAGPLNAPGFTLDQNNNFVSVNSGFENLMGDSVAIGSSYFKLKPAVQLSVVTAAIRKVEADKCTITAEDFLPRLNKWLEFRVQPNQGGMLVQFVDITERKNAEVTFDRDQNRWSDILKSCAVAVAEISFNGQFLALNSRCQEVLGYSDEQLKAKRLQQIFFAESSDPQDFDFTSLIDGSQKRIVQERQLRRANGQLIWAHLTFSLVRSTDGTPSSIALVFDDICERKEAEESLQFALDSAEMGDWDYDATNDATRRSDRFNRIFGYEKSPQDWSYADFLKHIHPEDVKAFDKQVRSALRAGENYQLETRIVWPDHSIHWISLRGRVYLDSQGKAVRMAGLASDITYAKNVENEIVSAKLAAEEASREKSYFLANMSHEIRTPLGAILGFTQVLSEPSLSDEDRVHYLSILDRNGHTLAKLIDDILDLSKVEAGHLETEKTSVALAELLDDIINLFQHKVDSKKISLQLNCEGQIPQAVFTDPSRLRQILINIIGNAVKFTHRGSVDIEVKCKEAISEGVNWLSFTVKDTGEGVSKEQGERLFHPFVQADNSTTRKFGGTGLGLALSRRLARALGGDVSLVKSQIGKGSTFLIAVPVTIATEIIEPPTKSSRPNSGPRCRSLHGLHILLAEDSEDNQELIGRMLEKEGATIEFAKDGEQALEKALDNRYDVVLMDMQMPKVDGYQATRELRIAGFSRPIIALTANAMRHDREKCLDAGCTEYVSKPIDLNKLYRMIEKTLETELH